MELEGPQEGVTWRHPCLGLIGLLAPLGKERSLLCSLVLVGIWGMVMVVL